VGKYAHAENRGTAANVKDDLVLEQVGVLVNGIAVAPGANLVFLQSVVSPALRMVGAAATAAAAAPAAAPAAAMAEAQDGYVPASPREYLRAR
jgi:hypothetical protein